MILRSLVFSKHYQPNQIIKESAFKFQPKDSFNGVSNRVNYCALTLYSVDKTVKWKRSSV
jgi:hypothetical protein